MSTSASTAAAPNRAGNQYQSNTRVSCSEAGTMVLVPWPVADRGSGSCVPCSHVHLCLHRRRSEQSWEPRSEERRVGKERGWNQGSDSVARCCPWFWFLCSVQPCPPLPPPQPLQTELGTSTRAIRVFPVPRPEPWFWFRGPLLTVVLVPVFRAAMSTSASTAAAPNRAGNQDRKNVV